MYLHSEYSTIYIICLWTNVCNMYIRMNAWIYTYVCVYECMQERARKFNDRKNDGMFAAGINIRDDKSRRYLPLRSSQFTFVSSPHLHTLIQYSTWYTLASDCYERIRKPVRSTIRLFMYLRRPTRSFQMELWQRESVSTVIRNHIPTYRLMRFATTNNYVSNLLRSLPSFLLHFVIIGKHTH